MDVAEACARSLRDRLREAFSKPGPDKPHRIVICLCETLWRHVRPSLELLAQQPANHSPLEAEVEVEPGTHRLIRFRFSDRKRILVAHCLR